MAAEVFGMHVSTPEVLWHGGGNENGKPDPVYSVDFHPLGDVLCTSGIDASVPPKGSVRIWKIEKETEGQECLEDFCDHQSAVNVARFSPDGKMLASASDRQIVVYVVDDPATWSQIQDERQLEKIWLRPSLTEVFDLQWSIDSAYLVIGSIDNKGEIIRVATRDSILLNGHTNYVQGVAWDPLNTVVVTQSADRSCKAHKLKWRQGQQQPGSTRTVKLAPRGHSSMRMHAGYQTPQAAGKSGAPQSSGPLTAADFGMTDGTTSTGVAEAQPAAAAAGATVNLFADSAYVPAFFRRPTFTPDGAYLITPTGIHRPPVEKSSSNNSSNSSNKDNSSGNKTCSSTSTGRSSNSYCTHMFARNNLTSPCVSLTGLDEPSVAVRCLPRPYKLLPHQKPSSASSPCCPADIGAGAGADSNADGAIPAAESAASESRKDIVSMIPGDFRYLFAVATVECIYIYDTQHPRPVAKLAGQHLAAINDLAWSPDGRMLTACSSDGYLTFARFADGVLGEALEDSQVPVDVQRAFPCLYHFTEPAPPAPATDASATDAPATDAAATQTAVVAGPAQTNEIGAVTTSATTITTDVAGVSAADHNHDDDDADGNYWDPAPFAAEECKLPPPEELCQPKGGRPAATTLSAVGTTTVAASTATHSATTAATTKATATASAPEQKKRKRIAPTMIAALTPSALAAAPAPTTKTAVPAEGKAGTDNINSSTAAAAAVPASSTIVSSSDAPGKQELEQKQQGTDTVGTVGTVDVAHTVEKKKRRIAPMLIATFIPATTDAAAPTAAGSAFPAASTGIS